MPKSEFRILIIDDEPDHIEVVSYHLNKEGYTVFTALNAKDGIDLAKINKPHLVILDLMMPEMDGVETCEQLRAIDSLKSTVITFLTARGEDYSQIAGFKAGADDYITKPVKLKVLSGRIKALLKKFGNYQSGSVQGTSPVKLKYGNLEIDRERHLILIDGEEKTLPRKEFKLLVLLSSKPGTVFNRENIFSQVWGNDVVVGTRTIDVHIRNLREKIGNHRIITVKGVGYRFKE